MRGRLFGGIDDRPAIEASFGYERNAAPRQLKKMYANADYWHQSQVEQRLDRYYRDHC